MQPLIAVPATALLVYRAYSRKSLTPIGIVTAVATAIIHAIHPWSVFFALLAVFFLGGTTVTKVKHDVKARLTLSASGSSSGEGSRTHVQVLANSLVASVLILLHAWKLAGREVGARGQDCWSWGGDPLVVGIVSNYAAVAADTFSSELGILSKDRPRLVTSLRLRQVPPGTNGGVTLFGIFAGLLGSLTIALTSVLLLPFCEAQSTAGHESAEPAGLQGGGTWNIKEKAIWVMFITAWGGIGSLVDSFLGGWLQASVVDVRTGKIVEGDGGRKVLVHSTGSPYMPFSKTDSMQGPPLHSNNTSDRTEHTPNDNDGVLRQRLGDKSEKQDLELSFRQKRHEGQPSRKIESGVGLLDNNAVNLLMAFIMSIGGIVVAAWRWGIPLDSIMSLKLPEASFDFHG
ncbi:hypothetical protein GP486_005774 [Trichoglossum hirsutum]|uniref:Integral membrane family protein n=1 Tax=Trichoglossum hirsutum TaxID=265104 RepID=A0A9P8L8Q4_9PEZI|nr:hypothetical protein GP486_005774 [Trichoglossum hirsutum]